MENIILVGIIPGPKEPSLSINSYLGPLVLELQDVYSGWLINITTVDGLTYAVPIRACIGCVACDIPVSQKICGFFYHIATKGCNKCII